MFIFIPKWVFAMGKESNTEKHNNLLQDVEQGVDALVQLTMRLHEENKTLARKGGGRSKEHPAVEKNRLARAKIETLITQLKSLE